VTPAVAYVAATVTASDTPAVSGERLAEEVAARVGAVATATTCDHNTVVERVAALTYVGRAAAVAAPVTTRAATVEPVRATNAHTQDLAGRHRDRAARVAAEAAAFRAPRVDHDVVDTRRNGVLRDRSRVGERGRGRCCRGRDGRRRQRDTCDYDEQQSERPKQ
jgi:hypothetical protein